MRFWFTLFCLLGAAGVAAGQPAPQRLNADVLARSQEWSHVLLQDLDQLVESAHHEINDPNTKRLLLRQTDELLGDVLVFQRMLQPGITGPVVLKRYREVDRKLDALLIDLAKVPAQFRGIGFTTRRLHTTHGRLETLMARLHPPGTLPGGYLVRHSQLLDSALHELDSVLKQVTLPQGQMPALRKQAARLHEALEAFRGRAAANTPYETLRRDYLPVDRAWERLDLTLDQMGLRTNALIRARWVRAEAQHEALSEMLRVEELAEGSVVEQLQGTWALVSIYSNGVPRDLTTFGTQRFIFKGENFTITENDRVLTSARYKVVDATGPLKKMDSIARQGNDKGDHVEAIFILRSNLLYYAPSEMGRPTEFGQNYYTVWRKVGP